MKIQPIHPFPARMAPSIVWSNLPCTGRRLRVLDPMAGSGTTLVSARARGHYALGCDTDPLALLIAQAWCSDVDEDAIKRRGALVLERAMKLSERIIPENAYPRDADNETRKFVDFWFDDLGRVQLASLATTISRIRDLNERRLLWCAFSRLIITKKTGASLAMDVSHSRPHRAYTEAPIKPFDKFSHAVDYVAKRVPFGKYGFDAPRAKIRSGDARKLPFESESIDMVITSPPYLNAIDYLRGHKLSLVWMGHSISSLRKLRSGNIGTEVSANLEESDLITETMTQMCDVEMLGRRKKGMLARYVNDMRLVLAEIRRVLKPNARAVFVIGDSSISGVFIQNSRALIQLGKEYGLTLQSQKYRHLPENRRYLPPPTVESSGPSMRNRMKSEWILTFQAL